MTYKHISTQEIDSEISKALQEMGQSFTSNAYSWGGGKKERLVYDLYGLGVKVDGDMVTPQIHVSTANDGSGAFRINLGLLRWLCENGLQAGDFLYSQRVVHREGPTAESKLAEMPDRIYSAVQALRSGFFDEVRAYGEAQITDEQAYQIIGSLPVSKRVRDQAIYHHARPRRSGDWRNTPNLWMLWNNVNESLREKSKGFTAVKQNDRLMSDIAALYGDVTGKVAA